MNSAGTPSSCASSPAPSSSSTMTSVSAAQPGAHRHDLLEALKTATAGTLLSSTSHLPHESWHEEVGHPHPALAHAILDRLCPTTRRKATSRSLSPKRQQLNR